MNEQAIADVINELYTLLVIFSGTGGVYLFVQGVRRLVWASQFGGMNSMGSRSFTSEAAGYLFGSLITITVINFIGQMRKDFFGMEEYSWDQLASGGTSIDFAANFFFSAFGLLGIWLVIKAGFAMPKISEGKETVGGVAMYVILALACTSARELNDAITELTVFNPLTFFSG